MYGGPLFNDVGKHRLQAKKMLFQCDSMVKSKKFLSIIVQINNLTATAQRQLRNELMDAGCSFEVTRGALLRRSMASNPGLQPLLHSIVGLTALISIKNGCKKSIESLQPIIKRSLAANTICVVGGILDGQYSLTVEGLANVMNEIDSIIDSRNSMINLISSLSTTFCSSLTGPAFQMVDVLTRREV